MKRKKHKPDPPKEWTARWQEGRVVQLLLWPNKHAWQFYAEGSVFCNIQIDRPLSQAELFRWLAKTQPIE